MFQRNFFFFLYHSPAAPFFRFLIWNLVICHIYLSIPQVHNESRENPFSRRASSQLLDPLVLALVQQVPGVGRVKALALLQHFSSLHQLCSATLEQLEPVVGQSVAHQIHNFFHQRTAGTWRHHQGSPITAGTQAALWTRLIFFFKYFFLC